MIRLIRLKHLLKRGRPKAKADEEDDEAEFLLKLELIELIQGYPEIYDIASPRHKKEYP